METRRRWRRRQWPLAMLGVKVTHLRKSQDIKAYRHGLAKLPALAFHLCPAMPATFSQPGSGILAEPCAYPNDSQRQCGTMNESMRLENLPFLFISPCLEEYGMGGVCLEWVKLFKHH